MKQLIAELMTDESGQDMIEYALIATLVGLSVTAVLKNYSGDVKTVFNNIGNTLTNAV
jgi:pilus assembly protein Flp/PilA